MHNNLLYIILPYTAFTVAVVFTIYRYRKDGFSYSSLSSQFLESKELFYGSVAWHFGVIGALTGHAIGFLFPKSVLWFNGVPVRLYILETTGLLFGLLALVGIVSLTVRRATSSRVRAVTSKMDVVVVMLLLIQVSLGVYIAVFYRWGSSWFVTSAVPYLRSLWLLQPDLKMIEPLPLIIKLHIVNFYLLLIVFPFSRLVHMLVVPLQYLWRPYQIVIWNWNRRRAQAHAPQPARQPAGVASSADEHAAEGRPVFTR
ncbi:MAG: respiratory nitrate reductase subunit gamma [Acidobacteria bacterium]|nr:respiratory nitrate reductase subunit gamma [Acidobacteriota bacterium]